jgi:hypothetical protein
MIAYRRSSFRPYTLWLWRALATLALAAGLTGAGLAQAASANMITLYAPTAPATAWIGVQFQTPDGAWHDVESWFGHLDVLEDSGLQFKQWAVAAENADQGPFRWVIYSTLGGSVWGISESFYLPGGDGANLAVTVETPLTEAEAADAATETATEPAATPAAATTPATGVLPVATDSSTWVFDCIDCGYGLISVYLPDAPAGSFAAVQYQMPDGAWHNVEGWAGDAAEDDNGLQQAHYSVYPENFGQGPFRWVVVQPDGTLWGIGAEFDLPSQGVHYFQFLLRH